MNNPIKIFLLIISVTLFSACCTNVSKENPNLSNDGKKLTTPTQLAINKSAVTAAVQEVLSDAAGNFIVKALIVKVDDNPSYPSLAMEGKTYHLIPNFQLDESKNINPNSDVNKNLMKLASKKPGDSFSAIIFYENLSGWFIQEVISNN